jgi:hypothetical protein
MRRRVSHAAIFVVLLLMSLSIPLMIQAIFPGGQRHDAPAPEVPVTPPQPAPPGVEASRTTENYAWLSGDSGSVLDAGDGAADEVAAAEEALETDVADAEPELPLDLRPGVFAGYTRSWDSLDVRREQYSAGAFLYIASHTRLQASGARLFFRDDADKISGNAIRLDGAHRLPSNWLLEEAVERDDYDSLHHSWNGEMRLSGALLPRLGFMLEGSRSDVWERLANIRDRLRLWQVGISLFYELLPRWWLAVFGNSGWYSDHNKRLLTGGEVGYEIAPRIGLSAAVGVEATRFSEQKSTYWSPSSYHYAYGRVRLSRDYERAPFEPRRASALSWKDRLGYLAEVTAGVNDDGHAEVSERAGLAIHATDSLSFRGEYFHLDSEGRFDDSYSENRLDLKGELKF